MTGKMVCAYCGTVNKATVGECIACGAPILAPRLIEPVQTTVTPKTKPKPEPNTDDLKKAGEAADKVYNTAWQAYAILWRTIGEIIAIAIVGFSLGLLGTAVELPAVGVICAVLVGVMVGLVVKNFWFTILGAPIGMFFGMLLWVPVWILRGGPKGMLFTAAVFAVLGAWLGQYGWAAHRQKNWYEKFRPLFGALGALIFALAGMVIALAFRWVILSLSR